MPDQDQVLSAQAQPQLTEIESSDQPPEDRAAKRLKIDSPTDSTETTAAAVNVITPPDEAPPASEAKKGQLQGQDEGQKSTQENGRDNRQSGMAPIKEEFLIDTTQLKSSGVANDDEAEDRGVQPDGRASRNDRDGKRDKKKHKGQNTERTFGSIDDAIRICNSRAFYPEFSPRECKFGDRCRLSHDLRQYLAEGRRGDVEVLGGKCHVFDQYGSCPSGWKCRFVKSHMQEIEREDGRKELVLLGSTPSGEGAQRDSTAGAATEPTKENGTAAPANGGGGDGGQESEDWRPGVYNVVPFEDKIKLSRKRLDFSQADEYIKWMNSEASANQKVHHRRKDDTSEDVEDRRAHFVDPPFKPSEKRRLYFGPETPTLAPLTTQGNLPFRRLCVELGCQLTYSEMAMSMPLLQGSKTDWTLLKAHESETTPPRFNPDSSPSSSSSNFVLDGYDNARDIKFGAQISGNQPWMVTKASSALSRLCPHLRLIDLNCGCPIDMVFKAGAGSALLDSHPKLERMLRGMNAVSGPVPITAKIRMGVRSNRPVATQLLDRLAFGSREHRDRLGAPGCAAVTLHGRSREQRYTKKADWGYIGECAALIKSYKTRRDDLADTAAEPDPSTLPNTSPTRNGGMYFLGNGDCYSHIDYFTHLEQSRVDSIMIGRGALIKPWIFEEIEKGQYLDKSSSQRLAYVEKFARYGLEAWGSDEVGLGFTRRFLLEWVSFAHRYVPIGLLERLPPNLNDRPPAYRGRDELETLMASTNYKDWIKITELFLGPVHPGFRFQPKHKSNAYEAEG